MKSISLCWCPSRTRLRAKIASVTNDKSDVKHDTRKAIAEAAGVSTGQIAKAEIVKREAPDLWEKAKAQEITIGAAYTQVKRAEKEEKREERREENRAKVAEVVAPAQIVEAGARFATIVIDPPWDWGDEGDHDQLRGFTQFSARPRHYESFVEPPSPAIAYTPAGMTQLWGMVPHRRMGQVPFLPTPARPERVFFHPGTAAISQKTAWK